MKIQLKKLILSDFRGITGTWELNPGRNVFSGPNGCGKTTLFDAVLWNMTGSDSQGQSDKKFSIKTIVDGAPISRGEHSVVAVYDVDGTEHTLSRTFKEKWSKKRGDIEETKDDSNQTIYSFDGVELGKRKYDAAIDQAFGSNYALCSDLSVVTGMAWKKRRELLIGMVGASVDPDKVISQIDGLSDFLVMKQGKDGHPSGVVMDVEARKKIADQRKKKLKTDLEKVNGALDERQADVDRAGAIDVDTAQKELTAAELAVKDAQKAIDDFKSGDRSGDVEKLKQLNADLVGLEGALGGSRTVAQMKENERQQQVKIIESELKNHREDLQDHQEEREKLLKVYRGIKETTPESVGNVCETCGQSLPDDVIEERRENFNRKKSDALEENIKRGTDIKAEIERIKKIIAEREEELKMLQSIDSDPILKQESTPEIDDLKRKISEINVNIEERPIPSEMSGTLEAATIRFNQALETRASIKAVSESADRLRELRQKKTDLSAENDRIEKFFALYDEYNQKLADAIEKPVNDLFEVAYFRMFDIQESGKQVPACEVMDKERRPYETALSNGERKHVEVDIARTMQKHFGIIPVVWIDNAESITNPISLDCQYIELRADDKHQTLTQEV